MNNMNVVILELKIYLISYNLLFKNVELFKKL